MMVTAGVWSCEGEGLTAEEADQARSVTAPRAEEDFHTTNARGAGTPAHAKEIAGVPREDTTDHRIGNISTAARAQVTAAGARTR